MLKFFLPLALLALSLSAPSAQAQTGRESCGDTEARTCRMTAVQLQFGLGMEQDLLGALNLLEDACMLGDAVSCTEVGVAFEMGIGAQLDQEAAKMFYQMGCNEELAGQCEEHGLSYLNSQSPIHNIFKAATILNQACWVGSTDSCFVAGRLNQTGQTGKPEHMGLPDSLRYYKEACRLGSVETCLGASTLIAQKPELALYAQTARAMLEDGCNLHKVETACVRLASLGN